MFSKSLIAVSLLTALGLFLVIPGQVRADTIAYWRFENENGNSRLVEDELGAHDGTGTVQGPDMETGGLWAPIPNPDSNVTGGASNSGRAHFKAAYDDNVEVAAHDDWTQAEMGFTIEAMIRPDSVSAAHTLVSHWNTEYADYRSWSFELQVHGEGLHPALRLHDTDGKEVVAVHDAFDIQSNETYAVAAAFDPASSEIALLGKRQGEGWMKQIFSLSGDKEFGKLKDPGATNLRIGCLEDGYPDFDEGPSGPYYAGDMDEVRFSSGALGHEDLLAYEGFVATPEPGTTCLAVLAAGAGVFAVWRKRRKQQSADDQT